MKKYFPFILITLLLSCNSNKHKDNSSTSQVNGVDTVAQLTTSDSTSNNQPADSIDNETETYFLVIADTNQSYFALHKQMLNLNKQLKISIDTMGRLYNKTKNLIALPDNDEDEIYAGGYYPRRFPSEDLSLEYLNFYNNQAGDKTIALVCGIYEAEIKADSALNIIKKTVKQAYKLKADIYIGCMH